MILRNINLPNNQGSTPLYIASERGHMGVVLSLLNANANPNIPNQKNYTPFLIAYIKHHQEIIQILASVDDSLASTDDPVSAKVKKDNAYCCWLSTMRQQNAQGCFPPPENSSVNNNGITVISPKKQL